MGNSESNTREVPRSAYPSRPSTSYSGNYNHIRREVPRSAYSQPPTSYSSNYSHIRREVPRPAYSQPSTSYSGNNNESNKREVPTAGSSQSSNSCSETLRSETNVNVNKKENVQSELEKILNQQSLMVPPAVFKDENDFHKNWPVWKEQFVVYIKCLDEHTVGAVDTLGYLFLNLMGPVGQNLRKKFIFNNKKDEEDLFKLIEKYDNFHSLYSCTKESSEPIDEYLNKKKEQFISEDVSNVDEELRKIIVMNINNSCKIRFVTIACSFLPKFQFTPTLQPLTLKEIIFLWKLSEESTSKNISDKFNANKECIFCGKFHERGKCPAWGKECNKCNKRNHFASKCPPEMYINDCNFCGGRHVVKKCPSFGDKCTICDHLNHFSWKCQKITYIKNCKFCGLGHNATKSECAARNSFCSICKTIGHFEIKCPSVNVNLK